MSRANDRESHADESRAANRKLRAAASKHLVDSPWTWDFPPIEPEGVLDAILILGL